MSILNEFNSQLYEAIRTVPVLKDEDLAKTCFNLVKYNNGLYKSDKQGWFIKSKLKAGELIEQDVPETALGVIKTDFNSMYGIVWKYVLDDKGILQQIKSKWIYVSGMTSDQIRAASLYMTHKQRERNSGYEQEMMQGSWKFQGSTVVWERDDV